MSLYTVYAGLALIHAFITCNFLMFFMKKMKMTTNTKLITTFVVYELLSFFLASDMQGILNFDVSKFNAILFALYTLSGICVTLGLAAYHHRGTLAQKFSQRKQRKG